MRFQMRSLILGVLGVFLSGCVSLKFERAWRRAEDDGSTQRWTGHWQSERHQARGRLRAVSREPRDGKCEVFFEAGWHGFTTAYPVVLNAEQKSGVLLLSGQHDLKSWVGGGTYTYSGAISGGVFSTRYASKYDSGTFTLAPVAAP